MARYISFELSEDDAEQSLFADYTLVSSDLMPYYFGNLATVNIFLGENNSGKSRFMREIMKTNPSRILDIKTTPEKLSAKVKALRGLMSDPTVISFYDMDVVVNNVHGLNDNFSKVILFDSKRTNTSFELKISPNQLLLDLQNLLNNFFSRLNSYQGILDFAIKSQDDNGLSEMTAIIASLERAKALYNAVANAKEYGLEAIAVS